MYIASGDYKFQHGRYRIGGGGGWGAQRTCLHSTWYMLVKYTWRSVYFAHESHFISWYSLSCYFLQSEYWFLFVHNVCFHSNKLISAIHSSMYGPYAYCVHAAFNRKIICSLNTTGTDYMVLILFSLLPRLVGLWYFVQGKASQQVKGSTPVAPSYLNVHFI